MFLLHLFLRGLGDIEYDSDKKIPLVMSFGDFWLIAIRYQIYLFTKFIFHDKSTGRHAKCKGNYDNLSRGVGCRTNSLNNFFSRTLLLSTIRISVQNTDRKLLNLLLKTY